MIIKENKNLGFRYFDFFIRVLALMHWFWLFVFRYYYFEPSNSHRLPIFGFLEHCSETLHLTIFILYTLFVFLFALRKTNHVWAFLIALSLFYFEFHDKYSFHHDIFLGMNVFFLFGLIKYHHVNGNYRARQDFIFALKVLCSLAYFFAGFHKLNEFFHSGILLQDMLGTGILRFVVDDVPIWAAKALSYFTLFVEFSFPLLIWTKWKRLAVSIAVLLHFGIAILGERGMLFNMYLPCMWFFFFSFSKIKVVEVRLKALIRQIDIFQIVSPDAIYKKTNMNDIFRMSNNIIWFNPIFILLLIAFLFNFLLLANKIISDLVA